MRPEQRRSLQKAAVKHAFEVITQRLREECEVLSMNPEDMEIQSFNAHYGQRHRRTGCENFAAKSVMHESLDSNGPIEIKSGLANVEVTLNVSYSRKHRHN